MLPLSPFLGLFTARDAPIPSFLLPLDFWLSGASFAAPVAVALALAGDKPLLAPVALDFPPTPYLVEKFRVAYVALAGDWGLLGAGLFAPNESLLYFILCA